jgi:transcriptional regulator with XRE-family HTH domain
MMRATPQDAKRRRASKDTAKRFFAKRLTAIMKQRGLSIAETARQMRQHLPAGEGFTAANLTHYRQGRSVPRPKYLEALSRVLEVDPSALIREGASTGGQPRAGAVARSGSSQAKARKADARIQDGHTAESTTPPADAVVIADYGDEVHIRIDQRLPWSVGLRILQALKGHWPDAPERS